MPPFLKSTLQSLRIGTQDRTAEPGPDARGPNRPANPAGKQRGVSASLSHLHDLARLRQARGDTSDVVAQSASRRRPLPGGTPSAERAKVNTLPSGPKIDASGDPTTSIDALNGSDLDALAVALHLAEPGATGNKASNTIAIRQRLLSVANDLDNNLVDHDKSFLDHPATIGKLSGAEIEELRQLMDLTHMSVKSRTIPGPNGPHAMLEVFFNGTQNFRDVRQDLNTAIGRAGQVDRGARRIGELMSAMLAPNGNASLVSVIGISMGGGSAQIFTASVDSRVALSMRPAVVLLDPALLNNRQAKLAVEGGTRPVDFSQPRGVAVTLDYAPASQRGLMSKMKTVGFHSPGLVRLKLGLVDQDGQRYGDSRPRPAPIGLGYHGRDGYYTEALRRFAGGEEPQRAPMTAFTVTRPPAMAAGATSATFRPPRPPQVSHVGQSASPSRPAQIDVGEARLLADFQYLAPLIK
ncbi:hypothetical protein [Cupriavidus pampae]|uniref:Type III effector protein n=1 Tax=Cupriavidus pampae TaxID=659251 RepID=A0ABN7XXV2_9BURK|nr:hypothetical protein [Cupriavidus pampae]CAG9165939.1 hypothetical protein LMG32289_00886 [Cupriavidus pampae]